MTLTIDFPQDIDGWLEEEASRKGQAPEEFVRTAIVGMRPAAPSLIQETDYDTLTRLIEENQMHTGITDLAYQHDHYLYGTPKRSEA